ncbi:MAG: sigma-54-dependent Fis family transcriptional regulator [Bacteroidetes bacterium]|nr:sigma-54-dependent Fis family transcriptional regulator [Bacteroidota bacterium]MBK8146219.1 sigma-54-dependent Fis family transcriptional regulator [Bacteroidota bacterium]MBP6315587.1 sigma-54-dependent Fis family transcriptional regulator [Chitinophagaceae bacterium]
MLSDHELQSLKNRFSIIGNDPSLNYALSVAAQVANTDLTVLIQGESGVGKEVFSQIIHAQSARKHNSFIAINCGAIPEGTIDSELFGHEKGSFTSATESRKGYFETVNSGTLFLDEIGELPLGTQARLLRVLETGEYIRVGSSKVQKTDVRVIAATNKDLLNLVNAGRFREDLYYRLSTVPIRVAALRERKADISTLFRKFCVDFASKYKTSPIQLTPDAKNLLINYRWPGNIRELKNIAEQISVLSQNREINEEEFKMFLPIHSNEMMPMLSSQPINANNDFANEREILYKLFFDMKKDVNELKKMFFEIVKNPLLASSYQGDSVPSSDTHLMPYTNDMQKAMNSSQQPIILTNADSQKMHDIHSIEESLNLAENEKDFIVRALKKHRSRRRDAASELGISERTLYRKIKEYDIEE